MTFHVLFIIIIIIFFVCHCGTWNNMSKCLENTLVAGSGGGTPGPGRWRFRVS
jgi:hypothetical protein